MHHVCTQHVWACDKACHLPMAALEVWRRACEEARPSFPAPPAPCPPCAVCGLALRGSAGLLCTWQRVLKCARWILISRGDLVPTQVNAYWKNVLLTSRKRRGSAMPHRAAGEVPGWLGGRKEWGRSTEGGGGSRAAFTGVSEGKAKGAG